MQLWKYVIMSCIVAASSATVTQDDEATPTNDVTSVHVHLIGRRPPARTVSSGGRLTLINARFNRRLKPRKRHLDREQLLDLLGDHLDPNWVSIEEPPEMSKSNRGSTLVFRRDGWQHVELSEQLRLSNLSAELSGLLSNETKGDSVLQVAVGRYLLRRATCPVRYFWDDIGTSFWPRYVRRGECPQVPGTCSWPPGMHCVASGTTNLQVLRWQCKARRRQTKSHPKGGWHRRGEAEQTSLKCHWVRVPYPITSNCLCSC